MLICHNGAVLLGSQIKKTQLLTTIFFQCKHLSYSYSWNKEKFISIGHNLAFKYQNNLAFYGCTGKLLNLPLSYFYAFFQWTFKIKQKVLCILICFRVLRSPASLSKYFFKTVFNLFWGRRVVYFSDPTYPPQNSRGLIPCAIGHLEGTNNVFLFIFRRFSWFQTWNHWKRFKINKKGWKRLKKSILTNFRVCAAPKSWLKYTAKKTYLVIEMSL